MKADALKCRQQNIKIMDIKVIKNKDVMTTEDLVNIKGGLNESLDSIATTCTCDCWISNSNTTPAKPSTSVKK